MSAAAPGHRPTPAVGVLPGPAPVPAAPVPAPGGRPGSALVRPGGAETSTRTVQGLLFVLGGLLLGTAATVFTAVAWASVGVAGRAVILLAFTALLLTVPLVARWRGLRGTAETFAAVGLLLVLLDGYAAWSVDLFGVTAWPGSRYAALVAAVGAAVALGYARLSRLAVPWFAALLVVQPVLPLLAAEARPEPAGWAVVFVGVALVDLAVVAVLRQRAGVVADEGSRRHRRCDWPVARWPGPVSPVGCCSPPAAHWCRCLSAGRVAYRWWPACRCCWWRLPRSARRCWPAASRRGRWRAARWCRCWPGRSSVRWWNCAHRCGLWCPRLSRRCWPARYGCCRVVGGPVRGWGRCWWPAAGAAGGTGGAAAGRSRSGPVVAAVGGATAGPVFAWGWQLPVAVVLASGAVASLLPGAVRPAVLAVGLAATAFAAPVAWAASWPAVVAIDLAVGAVLLVVAVVRPTLPTVTVLAATSAGAALLGHGLLVGLADPIGAGAACAVILAVGLGVAVAGRHGDPVRRAVAGCGLTAAVLVVPAGAAVALIGVGAPRGGRRGPR
ncbi:hypothetical protein GCM10029963_59540 [Micromonospora andamanensis]